MQLHPHFLFNTLNAISSLVRKNANREAVHMLAGLSDLLRLALENVGTQEVDAQAGAGVSRTIPRAGADPVPRPAYGSGYTSRRNPPRRGAQPDPATDRRERHPPWHRHTRGGRADRDPRREAGRSGYTSRVQDDGPGLPDESRGPRVEGVGLTNTRATAAQLYGDAQSFTLRNAPEGGTLARSAHSDAPGRGLSGDRPMPNDPIRTLIVDDEPLAREGLRVLLERSPEIEIVGECANGRDAVLTIQAEAPELVFLDVQMPR